MGRPAIVFPDVVALVVTTVQAGYKAQAVSAHVGNKVPTTKPRPTTYVVVRRHGGPRRDFLTDQAQISIECSAPTVAEAQDLAQLARALVHAMAGTVVNGSKVGRIDEFAGPAELPDPIAQLPRVVFTELIAVRGVELVPLP